MTGQELRIGNLVDHNGKIIIVNSIDDRGINMQYVQYEGNVWIKYKELKPAPLTHEKLFEFGFTKDENNVFYVHPDTGIVLWEENKGSFIFGDDEYHPYGREFNAAHDLQNIFWALTGKEIKTQ